MNKEINRKFYLLYLIIISIITGIVLLLAGKYSYLNNTFKTLFNIGASGILIDTIVMFYLMSRINKNKIENISDEREHSIIASSSALTGIVAFSLTPIMILFMLVLPQYMVLASLIYIMIIGAVMKISIIIFYKKY